MKRRKKLKFITPEIPDVGINKLAGIIQQNELYSVEIETDYGVFKIERGYKQI